MFLEIIMDIKLEFDKWLELKENLWGNIPCKGRKPSDGPVGGTPSSGTPTPMQQKMKKKMKK